MTYILWSNVHGKTIGKCNACVLMLKVDVNHSATKYMHMWFSLIRKPSLLNHDNTTLILITPYTIYNYWLGFNISCKTKLIHYKNVTFLIQQIIHTYPYCDNVIKSIFRDVYKVNVQMILCHSLLGTYEFTKQGCLFL